MSGFGHDSSAPGTRPDRRELLASTLALGSAAVGLGAMSDAKLLSADGALPVNPRLFSFVGGAHGEWVVLSAAAIVGDPLPAVDRIHFAHGGVAGIPDRAKWVLRGVTSNARYATRDEKDALASKQAALGRPECNRAALIPIRKNAKWWDLTQDERREIFEDRSKHTAIGLKYLPAIARRLHHCRDLGEAEPFDFLTLFDFAEADTHAFDDLVAALRATQEWKFVEREVDIRLARAS